MSDGGVIEPGGIYHFTGDLDQLTKDAAALAKQAGQFRDSGADVHKEFQGLSAFYHAPEAERLFATTAPVAAKSDAFAGDLEKVAGALTVYGDTVRPLAKRLEDLKAQALAFTTSIEGDAHWHRDQDKVDRNNALKGGVEAAMQAFYEAEIACHNTITALVGGTTLVLGGYGTQKIVRMGTVEYGARAEDLSHFGNVAWGSAAEREFTGADWWLHQGRSLVWDGFIVDGIGGTLKGIALLTGADGWDAAGKAWTGLAKVATGLAIAVTPGVGGLFLTAPAGTMPKWLRDSRTALKETGKALIAYDEWGKNPARAAGGVAFNVLTTVFTGGTGTAAKGGAVARTVSALGKAGRAVDPMTYVFKAGGFGTVKVLDLFKTLKGLPAAPFTDGAHLTGPHIEWTDGSRLTYADGEFTVTHPDGTTAPAPLELSAADRTLLENHLPHHEPAMAGGQPGEHTAGHDAGPDRGTHIPEQVAHSGGHPDHGVPAEQTHAHPANHSSPANSGGHDTGPHDSSRSPGHGGDSPDPGGPHMGSGHGGDTPTTRQDPPSVEELPRLPEGGRIPQHTFEHVLQGELKYDRNGNPRVTGYHFRPGGRDLNRHMVKVPKIIEFDHKTGLTTGNVWMRNPRTGLMVMKRAKTTFFPPGWTEKQVRRAMEKAFENGRVVDQAKNMWQGEWKGITFEGYFDPITGDAKTIYPLMP
ncbi:EndoU domain-containing protein [Streptomyces sp. NPDC055897]